VNLYSDKQKRIHRHPPLSFLLEAPKYERPGLDKAFYEKEVER